MRRLRPAIRPGTAAHEPRFHSSPSRPPKDMPTRGVRLGSHHCNRFYRVQVDIVTPRDCPRIEKPAQPAAPRADRPVSAFISDCDASWEGRAPAEPSQSPQTPLRSAGAPSLASRTKRAHSRVDGHILLLSLSWFCDLAAWRDHPYPSPRIATHELSGRGSCRAARKPRRLARIGRSRALPAKRPASLA
jgi:hypothetical protein